MRLIKGEGKRGPIRVKPKSLADAEKATKTERFLNSQAEALDEVKKTLGERFPWLYTRPELRDWVDVIINRMVAGGMPNTLSTYINACDAVAKKAGIQ